jgi:hypothetical protein
MLALACGALFAAGCSTTTDTPQGETGSLSLDLVLSNGVEIDEVRWQITGNDMDMSGDIDVSAPGSTASVEVFGLPPNDGVGDEEYVVELSAVSVDEDVTCRGSTPFDVEVGIATNVMVRLNCKLPQTLGGVRVNGEFNICAELAKMVVSPLETSVDNDIDLSALGFDADGDPIQYIWSASGGSIADSNAASTTYTCEEIGVHEITVNVTDNDTHCRMAQWTVDVQCVLGEVECILNSDCDDGQQCTVNGCDEGRCVTVDRDLGDTCDQDDGTVCDGDGNCVECNVNDDCGLNQVCDANTCVEEAECTLDPECNDGMQCTLNNCVAGVCITTDSDPGDTCDEGGGSVCDGSGSCVECVTEAQCSGGDQCNAPACADNLCGTVPDREGLECDLVGAGDGICEDGDCVEPPDCTSPGDCIDGNPCTIGDCSILGECVFDPNDGASCDMDGTPGTCDGTMCVGLCVGEDCTSQDQCFLDGTCDDQTGECIPGNAAPESTECDLVGSGDGVCDGSGTCVECNVDGDCGQGEICEVNTCVADVVDPDPIVCDPADGDQCEAGCFAVIESFGLPIIRVVDVGPLSGAQTEVCFESSIPLSEDFIALAGAAIGVTFASAQVSQGLLDADIIAPGVVTWTNTVPGGAGADTLLPGPPLDQTCPAGNCPPDGIGFFIDLLVSPPGGLWFIPFPEQCGSYTVPASGEEFCFNLKGTVGDADSETQVSIFARDTTGFVTLPAAFLCGPADQAGLDQSDIVCTPADDGANAACMDVCASTECTTDEECQLQVDPTSTCDTGAGICSAGTCSVVVIDDPLANQTCITVP